MYVFIIHENHVTGMIDKKIIKTGKLNLEDSQLLIHRFLYKKLEIPIKESKFFVYKNNTEVITNGDHTWTLQYVDDFTDYSRYTTKINRRSIIEEKQQEKREA